MADLKTLNLWIAIASFLGAFAVILGAFGAHYLKALLSSESLASYHTAVQYLFIHSILMLLVSVLFSLTKNKELILVLKTLFIGIICFSGSIFLLSTRDLTGFSLTQIIGPITPIGGILLIFSWLYLAYLGVQGKILK